MREESGSKSGGLAYYHLVRKLEMCPALWLSWVKALGALGLGPAPSDLTSARALLWRDAMGRLTERFLHCTTRDLLGRCLLGGETCQQSLRASLQPKTSKKRATSAADDEDSAPAPPASSSRARQAAAASSGERPPRKKAAARVPSSAAAALVPQATVYVAHAAPQAVADEAPPALPPAPTTAAGAGTAIRVSSRNPVPRRHFSDM